MAKGAGKAAAVGAAECVTVILDEPEVVGVDKVHDRVEVEGVAEGMGDHDCAGAWADCLSEAIGQWPVITQPDVNKDRDEIVLNDWVDG